MMGKVFKTFTTTLGGIVQIIEDEATWTKTGKCYDARWVPDFMISMRLGEGSAFTATPEATIEKVRQWDPGIEEITDVPAYLANYVLFAREPDRSGRVVISLKNADGCNIPIKAKDVPAGCYLINHADDFFRFYKGYKSVSEMTLV